MYAITYSDVGGKTHVLFHDGRGLIFFTKQSAKEYESNIFVPYLKNKITHGNLIKGKGWFKRTKYEPLSQEELRYFKQIMNTISIRKVASLKYSAIV